MTPKKKVKYEVRKIHWDKHDRSKIVWVIFRVENNMMYAIANTPIKENAYAHARLCREYGSVR